MEQPSVEPEPADPGAVLESKWDEQLHQPVRDKDGRMLYRSGISLHGYLGAFCWHTHERRHPLRAEQFGKWLAGGHSPLRSLDIAMRSGGRQRTHNAYIGMTGVVMFRNFWGQGNQGDHVDLWDGYTVSGGKLVDYFERSEEIWFWDRS